MNRNDFRRLAGTRLKDAETLLRNGRYEGCYYLCGYVIECGLKACVAKLTRRHDFPDKALFQDAYTHDLSKLLKAARLETAIGAELDRNREFRLNWYVVKERRDQSRYEVPNSQRAEDLFNAVADRKHGVLRWIEQHW